MNSYRTKRLHDTLYLKENRYEKPKENFKYLISLLKKRIKKNVNYKLLDIGCSNGELLWNLSKNFNNLSLHGLDIRKDLIKKASKVCNNIKFFKKDISKKNLNIAKFDIIIISGVISCTNNPEIVIRNLKKNLKQNGLIFLFDNLNDLNFNNFLRYEDVQNYQKILQSGYNIYSIKYLIKLFKKIAKSKKIEVKKFSINKKINPIKKDLMRSWTITIDKKRYFTNGTGLILKQFWLIVKT